MGHICSCSLCSWACSLELSQSQPGLLLHIPRIPSFEESLSILVHLSLCVLQQFYLLRAGLNFSFSLFHKAQSLLVHGFGSLPIYFSEFGSYHFLESLNGSYISIFVLFWVLIQYCDILDLNTWHTSLTPGSVLSWNDLATQFMKKFFTLEEKRTLSDLQHEKQRVSEGLLEYIRRFRDLSLLCYELVEEERLVDVCIVGMLYEYRPYLENL